MKRAFTLIELLVVVTIIILLLAMLSPALSKALYQAQLAHCGSNQKAVTTTVAHYAFANRRHYPVRPSMAGPPETRAYTSPLVLATYVSDSASYDFRPVITNQLGLSVNKNMQCALVDPMGLDQEDTLPDETVHAGQAMWFGWYYTRGYPNNQDLPGMRKLGDRWEWWVDRGNNQYDVRRYSLMFSDFELNRRGQGCHSAHPDVTKGVLWNYKAKRVGIFTAVTLLQTYSWWIVIRDGSWEPARGPVDLNFGYADGSVRRINGVAVEDDRMARVPNTQTNDEPNLGFQVPRE